MQATMARLCLAMIAPLLLLAGCSNDDGGGDGNSTTNINYNHGTDAQDTLDLNLGTDARLPLGAGFPLFVGPTGSVLMPFEQDHVLSQGVGGPVTVKAFNYARVLGDTPGPIMPMDDHANPFYDSTYEFARQSWNLRFVAFANQSPAGFSSQVVKVVVFDFQTGAFTTPALIASSTSFAPDVGFNAFLDLVALHVDNSGLVTVMFRATGAGSNNGTDIALWAVQYDVATQTIVRAPTVISGPFATQSQLANNTVLVASRIAANGDVAVLFTRTEDFDPGAGTDFRTVLRSTIYSAATDTWGAPARADNGQNDGLGRPIAQPVGVVLDTDAASLQYAFVQDSAAVNPVPGVYASRLTAGAGAGFPAPTRLDTTTFASNFRVQTPPFSQPVGITFGRTGHAFVHWFEIEDDGVADPTGTLWMSNSSPTVAPASANSVELLNATQAGHPGYMHDSLVFGFPPAPDVAFDDNGNALITFVVEDNDATPDAELHVARFNGTTFTASTPGTGNLATEFSPGVGQTREVFSALFSGYSSGATPTCVMVWASELRNAVDFTFVQGASSAILFTGAAAGTRVELEASSVATPSATPLSFNRFRYAAKNVIGFGDVQLITDDYPAVGNGNVWIVNIVSSSLTGSSSAGYQNPEILNFNPAVHTNVSAANSVLVGLGQIGHFESWSFQPNGHFEIAWGVLGLFYQRAFAPAVSSSGGPGAAAPELLTPPDMANVSPTLPQGLHVDGYAFIRTFNAGAVTSTFVSNPRRWTIWMGSDTMSQRIFGVRSR